MNSKLDSHLFHTTLSYESAADPHDHRNRAENQARNTTNALTRAITLAPRIRHKPNAQSSFLKAVAAATTKKVRAEKNTQLIAQFGAKTADRRVRVHNRRGDGHWIPCRSEPRMHATVQWLPKIRGRNALEKCSANEWTDERAVERTTERAVTCKSHQISTRTKNSRPSHSHRERKIHARVRQRSGRRVSCVVIRQQHSIGNFSSAARTGRHMQSPPLDIRARARQTKPAPLKFSLRT